GGDIRRLSAIGLKISIYNEPNGSGIGGSEFVAALLAETLATDHQVTLFHRIPTLTAEQLAVHSGTRLDNIRLHYVNQTDCFPQVSRRHPLAYYRELQRIQAEL